MQKLRKRYLHNSKTSDDLADCADAVEEMAYEGFALSHRERLGLVSMLQQMARMIEIIGDTIGQDEVEDLMYDLADRTDKVVSQFAASCIELDSDENDN